MSAPVRGGRVVESGRVGAGGRETEEPDGRRETRMPEEGRRYSWIEDHLARLDGKEARSHYYAWLG